MNVRKSVYEECVSSVRTLLLFVLLMVLFGALFVRNFFYTAHRGWGITFGCFSLFFLFYIFNYRVLHIQIREDGLTLTFGIFSMYVCAQNIDKCYLDNTSLWRIGGAGIHFSPIGGRYRAMFNFLQYPRLVVCLKEKQGWVRDVAFTTCHPDEVMTYLSRKGEVASQ